MIKNDRFFVAPQKNKDNFKVLFSRLAALGAGRPVDEQGFADGPWTPETLADAISSIDANRNGIELRAVQTWFQDNDNGISNENIRWLARIFGCNDPEATSQWQAELMAAKDRLTLERREKRKRVSENEVQSRISSGERPSEEPSSPQLTNNRPEQKDETEPATRTLAERCERILSGAASLNLQIGFWLVFFGLGFVNYVLGTMSVTYSPYEGLDKQVGFIWSPSLTVLPLVVFPAYMYFVSDIKTYWKRVGRAQCTSSGVPSHDPDSHASWYAKVNDFSFSFRAIVWFSFFVVFGCQWAGLYLPAYLTGDNNGVQIDRYLVALVRPEVISIPEAMLLSVAGYLYIASYTAIFMFGLLFLMIIVLDYEDICTSPVPDGNCADDQQLRNEGHKIIWGVFRVVVCALWLATLVRLQFSYLSSDSPDFVTWLRTDVVSVFDAKAARNGWLENGSSGDFTSFMMMVVAVTIFVVSIKKIRSIFVRSALHDSSYLLAQDKPAIAKMILVVALLSIDLVFVGRFSGFSLLLAVSTLTTVHVMSGPRLKAPEMPLGSGFITNR